MADKRPAYIKDKKLQEADAAPDSTLGEMALKMRGLKDDKDALEDKLTQVNKDIAALSLKIDSQFESMKIDKVRVTGAGTLYVGIENHPNVNDPEGFIKWLDDNGEGAMAKRTIHPSTLKSWVTEMLKANKALPKAKLNGKEWDLVTNFQERRIKLLRR